MIVISGIEDITGGQGYFYLVSPTNRNIQRATQMKQVSPRYGPHYGLHGSDGQ